MKDTDRRMKETVLFHAIEPVLPVIPYGIFLLYYAIAWCLRSTAFHDAEEGSPWNPAYGRRYSSSLLY